ncbi:hypothetical protein HK097_004219 [Rhizophlyctis rosea]|uniref:Peptidase M20 dimerisation domain-containing protein n=1 Tax=Rhizophlyctis rosea TaxID=64517 RepID=A0AAD5X076_9FUNG|nr:hypothetical protein HK097_004219 [Rhizophlyctis rosea]
MPSNDNAILHLSSALSKLSNHPLPATLSTGPIFLFLSALSTSHPNPFFRFFFRTIKHLGPFLTKFKVIISPAFNAMTRSTVAVTSVQGGGSDNALPMSARALLSVRVGHGDTVESVLEFVRGVVGADVVECPRPSQNSTSTPSASSKSTPKLTICILPKTALNPSAVASPTSPAYNLLAGTIRHVYEERHKGLLVFPSLLMAGTDSVWFDGLSDTVLKFQPIFMEGEEDLKRMHGTNERIRVQDFDDMIRFFTTLIRNADDSVGL